MAHTIERAASGRAKCRGCGKNLPKGELRVGERLPNPFAEGEMTLWFHVDCAAYKRPEVFLEALKTATQTVEHSEALESIAEGGAARRRLPRIDGGQLAPTGRARCRSCRELIEKGAWRIKLVFYEEGRFQPSGFVHARCSRDYFETSDVIERVKFFSPELSAAELEGLQAGLEP